MTGEEEQVGGFDIIYKNNKRVKFMSRNISLLGCLNDRDQKMRKMAKATALRLAEKYKETASVTPATHHTITNSLQKGGKSTGPSKNSTACNTSQNMYAKARLTHNSNRSVTANNNGNEVVRLPKVANNSSKNIEAIKKNTESLVKIANSRERGK
jgi:tubulin polyglutamylase TTLL9